jgi:hypothetical protein
MYSNTMNPMPARGAAITLIVFGILQLLFSFALWMSSVISSCGVDFNVQITWIVIVASLGSLFSIISGSIQVGHKSCCCGPTPAKRKKMVIVWSSFTLAANFATFGAVVSLWVAGGCSRNRGVVNTIVITLVGVMAGIVFVNLSMIIIIIVKNASSLRAGI